MNRAMRSLGQMTLFQFRHLYRNKIAFFFNLIFPLLMVGIFGLLFGLPSSSQQTTAIGWVDQDNGSISQALSKTLEATGLYTIVPGDRATLEAALREGKIRAALVLPEGLSAAVLTEGGIGAIRIMFDPVSPMSGRVTEELRQLVLSVDARMQGAEPRLNVVVDVLPEVAGMNAFDYLIPGQMAVMLLSSGLTTVGIAMAAQRQTGVLRHLFSTPLSIGTWAGTRVLANLAMAVLQGIILFVFAGLAFNVASPANLIGSVVVVLVCALASLSMGMLVGVLVKGEGPALAVTMPIFMVFLFLGNAAMPLQDPPAIIATILPYVPSYHMTNAMRAVMMQGAGVGSLVPELTILVGLAVAFFSVSLWRLRRQYIVV